MSPVTLSIVYVIVILVFIVLSFFFSSSDMAYGSVSLYKLEDASKEPNAKKSVIRAFKLARNYDNTISTILLLNDTVNAGLDSVSTLLGVNLCYIALGEGVDSVISDNWGFVASIICLILKIIVGEIFAKSMGKIYNYKLTVAYSGTINVLYYVTWPITFIVANFGKVVSYPILKAVKEVDINEDDLHEMVDDIEAQGSVDKAQANLLHDAITYTHTEAYEIMTPRVDIYAIDIDEDIEEYIHDERIYKYTRIPVFEDTIDNIIGYVNSKALILLYINNKEIKIKDLLIKPLKFPRSTEINDILKVFKKEKQHFGLVMDEYGGVEGLITMEDILEELVGDIWDENDDKDKSVSMTKNGDYIVDGMLNLEDFCALFDIDYDEIETEYVTIGGYCIELLDDKFAKINDVIQLKNLRMKVIALDKNGSIDKLYVTKVVEGKDRDKSVSLTKNGDYIVDGMLNLKDFCTLFDIDYDEIETEYVTIGEYCIELVDDKFAKINDEIQLKNLRMKVIALDKNGSIDKLYVTKVVEGKDKDKEDSDNKEKEEESKDKEEKQVKEEKNKDDSSKTEEPKE